MIDLTAIQPASKDAIAEMLRTTFVQEFSKVRGPGRGVTVRSIKVSVSTTPTLMSFRVTAGPGYVWATRGKRANTKLPVRKTAGGWDLVEPLKHWHAVVTPNMPKFLLARAIARKARAPIPLTARSETVILKKLPALLKTFPISKMILASLKQLK